MGHRTGTLAFVIPSTSTRRSPLRSGSAQAKTYRLCLASNDLFIWTLKIIHFQEGEGMEGS